MLPLRLRRLSLVHALWLAAPLLAACGSSEEGPTGPKGGENQTASAVATPSAGTVTRGTGSTNTTVVITATGGLTMGAMTINRQYAGISVNFASTQTTATTITRTYTFAADATVPVGNHAINFIVPISGYTGSGAAPTASVTYTLTVN